MQRLYVRFRILDYWNIWVSIATRFCSFVCLLCNIVQVFFLSLARVHTSWFYPQHLPPKYCCRRDGRAELSSCPLSSELTWRVIGHSSLDFSALGLQGQTLPESNKPGLTCVRSTWSLPVWMGVTLPFNMHKNCERILHELFRRLWLDVSCKLADWEPMTVVTGLVSGKRINMRGMFGEVF